MKIDYITVDALIQQLQALVDADPLMRAAEVFVYAKPSYGEVDSAPFKNLEVMAAGGMVQLNGNWEWTDE